MIECFFQSTFVSVENDVHKIKVLSKPQHSQFKYPIFSDKKQNDLDNGKAGSWNTVYQLVVSNNYIG